MRYISFKIIIICIFLPPVLYLATINRLEPFYNSYFLQKIKNTYLEESNSILNGSVTVKDAVNTSISEFIKKNPLIRLGIRTDIIVTTRDGIIIYPSIGPDIGEPVTEAPIEVARKNFLILQNGLNVDVKSAIRPFSALAAGIMGIYLLLTAILFFIYYRRATRKIHKEDREKEAEITRLRGLETDYTNRINLISTERECLLLEYENLKTALDEQKKKAERNEEDMFGEMEHLEQKLKENLSEQEEQIMEIETLKEQINGLEKIHTIADRQKAKAVDRMSRRFKTLYKNTVVSQRACSGFVELDEDMALKAEEIIHQLNEDSTLVPVKRKVFSKKSRKTIFEVVFAYRGRLYFSRTKNQRVEIVTIGNKNSQNKDLAYIDTL
ncbi:MAG: hypothetical protein GXP53_09380 [Deltaproteobacteria bacterium]|nr:hypothetical protein [Deltaproteobacteria bacterium]